MKLRENRKPTLCILTVNKSNLTILIISSNAHAFYMTKKDMKKQLQNLKIVFS